MQIKIKISGVKYYTAFSVQSHGSDCFIICGYSLRREFQQKRGRICRFSKTISRHLGISSNFATRE